MELFRINVSRQQNPGPGQARTEQARQREAGPGRERRDALSDYLRVAQNFME